MDLLIKESNDGVCFSVKVTPRAAKEAYGPVEQGLLKVRLNAPPVDGAANEALRKLLAKTLGVAPSRVKIQGGEKSRQKTIFVQGLNSSELKQKICL